MKSKRILITGLATYWGGRLAKALEADPEVEVIIGVDTRDPRVELERTEFVRIGTQHALIRRIVHGAEIDTVIDTRLVVDSIWTSPRVAHEQNIIGTMNILTACGGEGSPVEKFIFKSAAHYYGCERDDPAFFTEEMNRPHPPRTPIEKDIVEAERAVADFARAHPQVSVAILRFVNGLGGGLATSHHRLFSLPAIPAILGFDPRYQFIHEDDLVGALEFALRHDLHGTYNGAADGVLALSEVAGLLGKPLLPILAPWGTGLVAGPLRRLGVRIPDEMLNQLRYGRGLDNRKLKAAGYTYEYTTREAVLKLNEHQRTKRLTEGSEKPYRYEREVEEFLRWSPSVRVSGAGAGKAWTPNPSEIAELQRKLAALGGASVQSDSTRPAGERPPRTRRAAAAPSYADMSVEDVVALLPSLEPADLRGLRRHEQRGSARTEVLEAIERLLTRPAPA